MSPIERCSGVAATSATSFCLPIVNVVDGSSTTACAAPTAPRQRAEKQSGEVNAFHGFHSPRCARARRW